MRSPFAFIRSRADRVVDHLASLVTVLLSILERLGDIHGAIASLEDVAKVQAGAAESPLIAALAARMDDLTTAVDEGVKRVSRSENRVRAIVDGAKKQLTDAGYEHAGVDAEVSELRELDEADGRAESMPPVRAPVADDSDAPSSIPGVTVGQIRRAYSR